MPIGAMALGAARGAAAPAGIALSSRGTFAATSASQFAAPKRAMALRGGGPMNRRLQGDAVPEVTFKCRVRDDKVRLCRTHTPTMMPCKAASAFRRSF